MSTENKPEHKRLQALQLADRLGNVSQACEQLGISRSQFYEYKRRFQKQGIVGLQNRPSTAKFMPLKTSQGNVDRILKLSSLHPTWGCGKLSKQLQDEGISVSSPTVQKILIQHNLGRRLARLLQLEEQARQAEGELTPEQITLLEEFNPCFGERHIESKHPGHLLAQQIEEINVPGGIEPLYLHVVVDMYNSYAFCTLTSSHQIADAISLLDKVVLPFYNEHELCIRLIQTPSTIDFPLATRRQPHAYSLYLIQHNITHDLPWQSPSNGFIERFLRTVKDEFFSIQLNTNRSRHLKQLQGTLDKWLHTYNHVRPHLGYRNYGRPPMAAFNHYLRRVRKAR